MNSDLEPKMQVQLTTGPLENLINKEEIIDIRLNEPRWKNLEIGDIIEFVEDPSKKRKVKVKLIEKNNYNSFEELYLDNENYFDKPVNEVLEHLYKWWTHEQEKEIGVLGLIVRII